MPDASRARTTDPTHEVPPHLGPDLARAAARFAPIGLGELADAALMTRTDVKFVFPARLLPGLLADLADDYRVLEVDGVRLSWYRTLYFDTPDFALYRAHHQGRGERYKVRERRYQTTDCIFLEVKRRTNKRTTVKRRVEAACWLERVGPDAVAAASGGLVPTTPELEATLWNTYLRVTLVNSTLPERVTLDTELAFERPPGHVGRVVRLPGVAIAEVKQSGNLHASPFLRRMRDARLRSGGFSKYCIGLAMSTDEVKQAAFVPELKTVRALTGRGAHER